MKSIPKLKGGRRHFHVIIFILSICILFPTGYFSSSTAITNSPIPPKIESHIETYTPQQIEVQKLYRLITQVSSIPDSLERYQLADAVFIYGAQFSIEPTLLLAKAKTESDFHKRIVGYGRCSGYWQINLKVHKVTQNFLNDTYEQCKKACEIYVYFRSLHKNNLAKTLNGYNGNSGVSNPYAKKVLKYYYQYNQMLKEIY